MLIAVCFVAPVSMIAQQNAAPPTGPVYVVVHVDVNGPSAVATANKLLLDYAAECRKDKGAVRIDVFVQDYKPNHYTVIEVWQTREAYEAHRGRAYSKEYREKLQPLLGSPLDERWHGVLQ